MVHSGAFRFFNFEKVCVTLRREILDPPPNTVNEYRSESDLFTLTIFESGSVTQLLSTHY